ncbi:hypothetical protein PQX77_020784 [Marasmius sp. AFHP31]|nr:hypothetical protein PQX77_020784 [Marasmius sp. AFHP31]
MAGLAPTLIIVRVRYKKSIDSVQQMVSMHFAEHDTGQETGLRAIQTTLDIQSNLQHGVVSSGPHVEEITAEEKHNEGHLA